MFLIKKNYWVSNILIKKLLFLNYFSLNARNNFGMILKY